MKLDLHLRCRRSANEIGLAGGDRAAHCRAARLQPCLGLKIQPGSLLIRQKIYILRQHRAAANIVLAECQRSLGRTWFAEPLLFVVAGAFQSFSGHAQEQQKRKQNQRQLLNPMPLEKLGQPRSLLAAGRAVNVEAVSGDWVEALLVMSEGVVFWPESRHEEGERATFRRLMQVAVARPPVPHVIVFQFPS